jgi:hypothetical protein
MERVPAEEMKLFPPQDEVVRGIFRDFKITAPW